MAVELHNRNYKANHNTGFVGMGNNKEPDVGILVEGLVRHLEAERHLAWVVEKTERLKGAVQH
jgi:hypothetical protein